MTVEQQWAVRPGERLTNDRASRQKKDYDNLVKDYKTKSGDGIMVLDDRREFVYFLDYRDIPNNLTKADVAVYDGYEYNFLPKDLAFKTAVAYLNYTHVMSEVYESIDFP